MLKSSNSIWLSSNFVHEIFKFQIKLCTSSIWKHRRLLDPRRVQLGYLEEFLPVGVLWLLWDLKMYHATDYLCYFNHINIMNIRRQISSLKNVIQGLRHWNFLATWKHTNLYAHFVLAIFHRYYDYFLLAFDQPSFMKIFLLICWIVYISMMWFVIDEVGYEGLFLSNCYLMNACLLSSLRRHAINIFLERFLSKWEPLYMNKVVDVAKAIHLHIGNSASNNQCYNRRF